MNNVGMSGWCARFRLPALAGLFSIAVGATAEDLQDLYQETDDVIRVSFTPKSFNRRVGVQTYSVAIKNVSPELVEGPLCLQLASITAPNVTVVNATGTTSVGDPYVCTSKALLLPGATVEYEVQFVNPERKPFSMDPLVYASSPDPDDVVRPSAVAGPDQDALSGAPVTLSGANSVDPMNKTLWYQWTVSNAPPGSAAALTEADTATPTFVPDVPGIYRLSLVVGNDALISRPDEVAVVARTTTTPSLVEVRIQTFYESVDVPAGGEVKIWVNGILQGTTGSDGAISVRVLPGPIKVRALETSIAGAHIESFIREGVNSELQVVLNGEGGVYEEAIGRIVELHSGYLLNSADTFSIVFETPDNQPVQLTEIEQIILYSVSVGTTVDLKQHFGVRSNRVVEVDDIAWLRQQLGALGGTAVLDVIARNEQGELFAATFSVKQEP